MINSAKQSTYPLGELPVHAHFPMGGSTRLVARAFVDFIEAELRSTPPRTPPAMVDDLPET